MDIVARILLTWLLCLVSVLFHELGHALGYRVSGGKAGWKVSAGSGPKMFSIARCSFCFIPVGGAFIPEEEPGTKKGKLFMLAGGPVVSLLLAVLFGVLRYCLYRFGPTEGGVYGILFPVSRTLLFFNFFQFLFTAVPIRYRIVCRGFESDGLQIVHVLGQKEETGTDS